MDKAVIVCVITLAVIVAAILILLGVLFYNQMLLTNEVNKRLLLITKESIDRERSSQEELNAALVELERQSNDGSARKAEQGDDQDDSEPEEPFNPHSYMEQNGSSM